MSNCRRLEVLGVMFAAALAPVAAAAVPDFCFIQVSDLHIGPVPAAATMPGDADNGRSAEAIAWVCQEARQGQRLEPLPITTPPPAFIVATGDLTEYGVIGKTWDYFERLFSPLEVPLYVVPGNHDNTWTSMMAVMRRKHGGDHYSFEKFGCHFVAIDSAGIQEPLPCLEARTLHFLRSDLKRVPKDRPVFIFQHHPLRTTEFAGPFEQLRFLEVLREHNVVLLLMGHGHNVRAERWNTLDSVMGGSTFGPNTGYSIISVMDGVLRVTYRYRDENKPMQKVLEKPIARQDAPVLELVRPTEGTIVAGAEAPVVVRLRGQEATRIIADIDGREKNVAALAVREELFSGSVPTEGLLPGVHYLHVKAVGGPLELERAVQFFYRPPGSNVQPPRVVLSAGMKAGPVPVEDGCLVATTDGRVIHIPLENPAAAGEQGFLPRVLANTGVEIIHAPAVADGSAYFSSAELGVFSVELGGKLNWKRPVGAAVYGTPALMGEAIYVGDQEGAVHAIDRRTGELKWSRPHATFSIEMPLVADRGVLYFGAWDGHVYAVNASDGSLKWKQAGPAGQTAERSLRSRYYAPADCPPVVIGDRLFVTDRSYRLGAYALDGKYLGIISEGVAAIGPTEDGTGFYARGLEKGITRYDGEGNTVWSQPLAMGRFPCPPAAAGGRVYACSNRGVLSALAASDGKVLWQYQASPQLHVMAPAAADRDGNVYVCGMDGSVTKVRSEK